MAGSPEPESPRHADLGGYIRKCYGEFGRPCPFGAQQEVFSSLGNPILKPQLSSNRINRILLFPGSFNPPHNGHLNLLRHVFESSNDINIIAAIVLPLSDYKLQRKCDSSFQYDMALTLNERVRLWRGDLGPSDWYWVFDLDRGSDWHHFSKNLERQTAKDGFNLRFVGVCGPDLMKFNQNPWAISGSHEIIVSDVGRPSRLFVQRRIPSPLLGYSKWEPVRLEGHEQPGCARDAMTPAKGSLRLGSSQEAVDDGKKNSRLVDVSSKTPRTNSLPESSLWSYQEGYGRLGLSPRRRARGLDSLCSG
ncbi:hypothetical protein CORC01_02918 [Colletotrichum orchidophilum]|uniref:Cytidyltransferase-like domain-containing protein n=1 Tax=Colletotrichum orchidophilum TaxID=1209926 RepID=A0A1G4BK99_9PEZI|nr:uncharacterized protein CORC01_02918 [Colletotrichum orchidophilum]OHF01727.1 hypothetical protein CORC01_02918 [Colletotrichum orchidophilum]